MVKKIDKPYESLVAGIADAFARIFGEMQGQGAVRAEHPEEISRQACRAALARRLEVGERRRCEDQRGQLPQAQRIVCRPRRRAEAWKLRMDGLDTAQRLKEIEGIGRGAQCLVQFGGAGRHA